MSTTMNYPVDVFKKYPNGVVIWGLRTEKHTHRYIHDHFYTTLKKLGQEVTWVDNKPDSRSSVRPGSLVISVGFAGRHLPCVEKADYCLHNFSEKEFNRFDPRHTIRLQVYTDPAEKDKTNEKWNTVTYFNLKERTLYQPWGTNLLPHEFKKPTVGKMPAVIWVGSIWDNELHQGNLSEIGELKRALGSRGVKFIQLQGVPDWVNVVAVKNSRIAPAIAGGWQVKVNYLPCRMFKNISYGQLGITNVKKFEEILPGCSIEGKNIVELIDDALSLPKKRKLEVTAEQQEYIKKHTYLQKLQNIINALEQVAQ